MDENETKLVDLYMVWFLKPEPDEPGWDWWGSYSTREQAEAEVKRCEEYPSYQGYKWYITPVQLPEIAAD